MTDKETLNKLADEHGYSDKMGNVSGLFEHFELGYNAAQAEIAKLKEKNESGCCIVEHGYRMQAEHDLTSALKIVSNLQSALDVAVEGLESFASQYVEDAGRYFKVIFPNGNLLKAKLTLEKIKQIRGIE